MKTLIIIPTYNELESLPPLLKEIFSYAPLTDILIIDDNSPDGTGEMVDRMSETDRRIHVLHRVGKLGLGTAYIAGFKYAINHAYDVVFEMDADFSHNPLYLPDFLDKIQDADLVIGSRYIKGGSTPNWSRRRRLISGCGNLFAQFVLQMPVHDCTAGYRCYRRNVLEKIGLDTIESQGYGFQVEMAYRVQTLGFKIVETPIIFTDRQIGTSKMSGNIVFEAFNYVLRARFSKQQPSSSLPAQTTVFSMPIYTPTLPQTNPLPAPLPEAGSPLTVAQPAPRALPISENLWLPTSYTGVSNESNERAATPLLFLGEESGQLAWEQTKISSFSTEELSQDNRSRLRTARVRLLPLNVSAGHE